MSHAGETMNKVKPHVLVLVSEPATQKRIAGILHSLDVVCQVEDTLEKAKAEIAKRRHHLILVQSRLDSFGQDDEEEDGHEAQYDCVKVLREVRTTWPEKMRKAVVFLEGRQDLAIHSAVRQMFEVDGGRVISEDDISFHASLQDLVRNNEVTATNWELEIDAHFADGASDDDLLAFEDILRQLFVRRAARINVVPLGENGFTGARLLRAASPGKLTNEYVVKLDGSGAIHREADALRKYVIDNPIKSFTPEFGGEAYARVGSDFGGLKYDLVEEPTQLFGEIVDAQTEEDIVSCRKSLHDTFNALNRYWYSEGDFMRQTLVLELFGEDPIPDAEAWFTELAAGLQHSVSGDGSIELRCNDHVVTINPFFRAFPQSANRLISRRRSMTHGDLHTRNILVNGVKKDIRLIDFASADMRCSSIDFAKLEAHLILDILPRMCSKVGLKDKIEAIVELYAGKKTEDFAGLAHLYFAFDPSSLRKLVQLVDVVRTDARAFTVETDGSGKNKAGDAWSAYLAAVLHVATQSMRWMKNADEFDVHARTLCLVLGSLAYDGLAGTSVTRIR